MIMLFYGTLIVSLFVLLIVGAGWLLRRREKEHVGFEGEFRQDILFAGGRKCHRDCRNKGQNDTK